jgi:hypothetical protein
MWRPEGLKAYLALGLGWDAPLIEALWINTHSVDFFMRVRVKWLQSRVESALARFGPRPAQFEIQRYPESRRAVHGLSTAAATVVYELDVISPQDPEIYVRSRVHLQSVTPSSFIPRRILPLSEFFVQLDIDIIACYNIASLLTVIRPLGPSSCVTWDGCSAVDLWKSFRSGALFGGRVAFSIVHKTNFEWSIVIRGSQLRFSDMTATLRIGGLLGSKAP